MGCPKYAIRRPKLATAKRNTPRGEQSMSWTFVSRRMLLAGTSAMAILAGASAAQAASWDSPGFYTFVATSSGAYAFGVIGAIGGRATNAGLQPQGGVGAAITGEFILTGG